MLINYWMLLFLTCLIVLLTLKYVDGLKISETVPAGIVGALLALISNAILEWLGFFEYNARAAFLPILKVPLPVILSAGLVSMIMIHFVPAKKSKLPIYFLLISAVVTIFVCLAVQIDIMKLLKWNYMINALFDFIALAGIYIFHIVFVKKPGEI